MKRIKFKQNQRRKITFGLLLPAVYILFFVQPVQAQVTIGSGVEPAKAALLDLKTKEGVNGAATTDAKGGGLLLPRVLLEDPFSLKPFAIADTDDAGRKYHTGLVVYNLSTTNGFTAGTYVWDGAQWTGGAVTGGGGGAAEVDGIIGNEVTDATASRGLVRGGAGTTASPYTLGINDLGVTTAMIANNAVTTGKIANQNVTLAKLANNSVNSAKIVDGSVATVDLADLAVTTAKIADLAVTEDKLAIGGAKNDVLTSTGNGSNNAVWTPLSTLIGGGSSTVVSVGIATTNREKVTIPADCWVWCSVVDIPFGSSPANLVTMRMFEAVNSVTREACLLYSQTGTTITVSTGDTWIIFK